MSDYSGDPWTPPKAETPSRERRVVVTLRAERKVEVTIRVKGDDQG